MKKIKELIIKYKELITYVIFGVATTLVNFVALAVLNRVVGEEYYLYSNVGAWFVSVIFAYVTNKLWVFESKSWKAKVVFRELVPFFSARILSLGIEELGLWLLVDCLKFKDYALSLDFIGLDYAIDGYMISKVILAVVVVILNYVFSKLIVFRKKSEDKQAEEQ